MFDIIIRHSSIQPTYFQNAIARKSSLRVIRLLLKIPYSIDTFDFRWTRRKKIQTPKTNMRAFNLFPITSLILGTTAATLPRQDDPHIVDFRTFGVAGCLEENQGVYTYLQSDEDICHTFADSEIGSIFTLDITDGCFRKWFTSSSRLVATTQAC